MTTDLAVARAWMLATPAPESKASSSSTSPTPTAPAAAVPGELTAPRSAPSGCRDLGGGHVHQASCEDRLRRELMSGEVDLPRGGRVVGGEDPHEPFLLVDELGLVVEPVRSWARELVTNDQSPRTVRAYCHALLTWYRVLWFVGMPWERATELETAAMVGWMRIARNPQRRRRADAPAPGSVNIKTGKPLLGPGYRPATINLTLAAVHAFYGFHSYWGRGPLCNPVPASPQRRRALMHRSPIESESVFRRARYRQKQPVQAPRSIPDRLWGELFDAMSCDRDRALLSAYVSSGARASELLGARAEDLDWARQRVCVVSKGSRERRMAPLSPEAMFWLGRYLDAEGLPEAGEPLWRTSRGKPRRALTYSAMRRVLQRANEVLGTNWTLHDLRHTAAIRMTSSAALTLPDVQVVLGHRDVRTTSRYTAPRVEERCDRLQEFHARPPAPPRRFTDGYDAADVAVVFGG
jgi:integrase